MVLAPRIEIKQSQKLMMNPQMQQAIKLLQLTNGQVTELLKREMEQNPFLALDETQYRGSEGKSPERAVTVQGTSGAGLGSDVVAVRVDFAAPSSGDAPSHDLTGRLVEHETLQGHISKQIGEEIRDADVAALALELVGWLDEAGYLRESDAEICATLHVPQALLDETLAACRHLTPAGVFARNLADCLKLQLAASGQLGAAHELVLDDLALLGKGDLTALAEKTGLDAEALMPVLQAIRACDPRPGAAFSDTEKGVAAPDVIVLRGDAGWQAFLNEATLPSVLVLERDWEEMATRPMKAEERAFMKANVQSARWLRKATQQRAATLLRVARAIVAHQQGFFDDGMVALQPMVLRDIAEPLELHESTVSRSSSGKLVQTPNGVFYLKDLFSTAVGSAAAGGGNAKPISSAAIKARLLEILADEEPHTKVLSDDALVDLLAEEGVVLARRTVAKYRKALNIASSAQRRSAAKIAAAAGQKR